MALPAGHQHLRNVFRERLGFAGGGSVRGQGLGWQTPSPEPDDYIKSLTHSLPRPSWSGTKGFVKDLFRDPMRLTQKYGIGYAPLDVVRDVASVIPGEGKAVAYGIDSMADAGASMLRSGLKDVPARIERSIGQTLDAVPDAARAAWDYLKSAGETSHDVAGYAGGGRISEFIKNLRSTMGASQAMRAEKAADLTDLSRLSDQGLLDLFHPANPSPILAMKPGDFQKFANPLPEDYKQEVPYGRFQNRSAYTARQKQRPLDLSHYLDLMGTHLQKRGADEPPLLWTYKNVDDLTQIEGHQGRHRMMAMNKLGDPLSLVKTLPAREGEGFMMDPDERVQYLMDKYFPLGSMTPVTPEAGGRPRAIGAEPFASGGSVFKELAKIGEKYAQRQGSIYRFFPIPDYDIGHAKKVAEAFEAMKHDPTNPDVKRSYDALIEETMQHLAKLRGERFQNERSMKAEMFTDLADERAQQRGVDLEQSMIDLLRGQDYPRQYKRGGRADEDFGLYHNMFFKHGGRVDEDFELFHAGPWEGIE